MHFDLLSLKHFINTLKSVVQFIDNFSLCNSGITSLYDKYYLNYKKNNIINDQKFMVVKLALQNLKIRRS